ncbi:MAG: hypothetical protein ACR2L9_03875 [Solirubrobacteraceae bacterium]
MQILHPLLLLDVDGVISLFGFDQRRPPAGRWQSIDGIPHYLSASAGAHLRSLSEHFELAWCTGWEEKANEYLPLALGLAGELPHLSFEAVDRNAKAHWKLGAVDRFAGEARPLAWIDDAHDHRCHAWARARRGPTLLVGTDPAIGLTAEHVETLLSWAASATSSAAGHGRRTASAARDWGQ